MADYLYSVAYKRIRFIIIWWIKQFGELTGGGLTNIHSSFVSLNKYPSATYVGSELLKNLTMTITVMTVVRASVYTKHHYPMQ